MESHKTLNPTNIRLLCRIAQMSKTDPLAYNIEQLWWLRVVGMHGAYIARGREKLRDLRGRSADLVIY
jgi:hypothetical protein